MRTIVQDLHRLVQLAGHDRAGAPRAVPVDGADVQDRDLGGGDGTLFEPPRDAQSLWVIDVDESHLGPVIAALQPGQHASSHGEPSSRLERKCARQRRPSWRSVGLSFRRRRERSRGIRTEAPPGDECRQCDEDLNHPRPRGDLPVWPGKVLPPGQVAGRPAGGRPRRPGRFQRAEGPRHGHVAVPRPLERAVPRLRSRTAGGPAPGLPAGAAGGHRRRRPHLRRRRPAPGPLRRSGAAGKRSPGVGSCSGGVHGSCSLCR